MCKYNQADACHAKAVTITNHADCGLYVIVPDKEPADNSSYRQFDNVKLKCKATTCHFNNHCKCNANGISVADEKGDAACFTYCKKLP